MKALRFHEFGSFAKLKLETLPDPKPQHGEVVVQVRAASLNPSDAKNVLGRMEGTTLPRTPGRDFAGVVVNGPQEMLGNEVWGTGGDLGFTRDGSYAERLVVPAAGVSLKPKSLSFEEASVIGTNFVTAWAGLIETARFQPGETLLARERLVVSVAPQRKSPNGRVAARSAWAALRSRPGAKATPA